MSNLFEIYGNSLGVDSFDTFYNLLRPNEWKDKVGLVPFGPSHGVLHYCSPGLIATKISNRDVYHFVQLIETHKNVITEALVSGGDNSEELAALVETISKNVDYWRVAFGDCVLSC